MSMDMKVLMELLRRTGKSKYKSFLLHNRMIMQCYDIKIDSDVGMHYILHIPDAEMNPDYADPFYDMTLILEPSELLTLYKEGHDKLTAKKKETSAKPKECKETVDVITHSDHLILKLQFSVKDELIETLEYRITSPVDENNLMVDNILDSYQNLLFRIRAGGSAVTIDGFRHGLYELAMDSVQIYFLKLKINGRKVRVPIYRSMFLGIAKNSIDEFFISVQETEIPDVYIYTIQLARNGLIEQFIGYIVAF